MGPSRRAVLAGLAGAAGGWPTAVATAGRSPVDTATASAGDGRTGRPRSADAGGADGLALAETGYAVERLTAHGRNVLDEVTDLVALSTGGYVIVGHTLLEGGRDVWLVRTAADGGEYWDQIFGSSNADRANAAVEDVSGDVVVAGTTAVDRFRPVPLFLRVDRDGAESARVAYDEVPAGSAEDVAAAADGTYRLLGWRADEPGGTTPAVSRVRPNGETVVRRVHDVGRMAALSAGVPTPDGGCLAAGWFRPANGPREVLVLRLDADDGVASRRRIALPGDALVGDVVAHPDGGAVAGGVVESAGQVWGWLVRLLDDGRPAWRSVLQPAGRWVRGLATTPDGGIVYGGLRDVDGSSALVGVVDPDGSTRWSGTFGPAHLAAISGIDAVGDGAIVAAGNTLFGQYGQDGYLLALRRRNHPPKPAIAVRPREPSPGTTVRLDASASSDPDGLVVAHDWDLDGDGTFDADGPVVERTFRRAGDHEVALRVTDDDGVTATITRTVAVREGSPSPGTGDEPALGVGGPGFGAAAGLGALTAAGLYRWARARGADGSGSSRGDDG